MTTPLSLRAAAPATPDAPAGTPDATPPGDAFASLLAALAGAVLVPTCAATQAAPTTTAEAGPTPGVAAGPRKAVAAGPVAVPAGPLAVAAGPVATAGPAAQTPAPLAGAPLPPTPAASGAPAPAASKQGTPVLAWDATGQRAAVPVTSPVGPDQRAGTAAAPTTAPPAVRRPRADQELAQPLVATPATAAVATAPAPTTAASPAARTEPTHHVQPAIVEAARGLRNEGGGRTSLVVRLDPPELGAVLVRLTVQDGRVDVQLRTPDLAARSDLQAQSYDVQQVLRDSGFDLRSFDVAQGDVLSGDFLPGGRDQTPTPDRGTPQQRGSADGAPSNARVTDDVNDPQPSGTWL